MSQPVTEKSKGSKKTSITGATTRIIHKLFDNEPGPLPLGSEVFQTDGQDLLVVVSGSGYRSARDGRGLVAFDVYVDEVTFVGTCKVMANSTDSHMATIPVTFLIQNLAAGFHNIMLYPQDGTTTDLNDFFNVLVEVLETQNS